MAKQTTSVTKDESGKVIETTEMRSPLDSSSVEFSSDSKGNVKPVVKVYNEDPYKALEIAQALMTKALKYARES